MTAIKINYEEKEIVISSSFQKKAFTYGTYEYDILQEVRCSHPDFTITVRQFKKKTSQEHYKGLTYNYMRGHIIKVEGENAPNALKELDDLIDISKCHSKGKRYPTIKKWFIDRYPEIAKFGISEDEEKVVAMPTGDKSAA